MFESLSEKLEQSFKMIKGEGKLTEINVVEALKEVRRALLDADVNYNIVKSSPTRSRIRLSVRRFRAS